MTDTNITEVTTKPEGQLTPESNNAPLVSSTNSIIDRAEATNKSMEAYIKRAEEILAKQEALAARQIVMGRAEGGQVNKSAEEIEKEKVDIQAQDIIKRFRR